MSKHASWRINIRPLNALNSAESGVGGRAGAVDGRPTGERTARQARNLMMDPGGQAHRVKFMIRDRGPDYTAAFDAVFADAGIRTVLCNIRTSGRSSTAS